MLGKEYFYLEKEKYKNKPAIKNLGIEESLYNSDKSDYFPKYNSPSLLIEEENFENKDWEPHENNIFKKVKFTTFRKLIKKQVKKQLWFGRYSFTYWGENIYKYQVKQYVPNGLPINCLDTVLIAEKVKHENKIIPFNYLDKSEWKEHLKSYLKKFHESINGKEELLTFENEGDIENLKWELENR